MKTLVPIHQSNFAIRWDQLNNEVDQNKSKMTDKPEHYYNKKSHELKPLKVKTDVVVQNRCNNQWKNHGTILAVGKYREYVIKSSSEQSFWRNSNTLNPLDY